MTRKEELLKRAEETTEQLLDEGVCLSNGECGIADQVILRALQHVEREVLQRASAFYTKWISGKYCGDYHTTFQDWCDAQQKELG